MKDFNDERTAILAVVVAETNAYLNRDFDAWVRHWHDGPEIRRIHAHAGIGVIVLQGAEIRDHMRRMLEERPQHIPTGAIRRENMNIVISPEMAWVSYDQIGDVSGEIEEMAGRYHELKILQKFDGAWKLTCIVGTQVRIDHVSAPLVEMTDTGRLIWMNEAAKERLPLHPKLARRGVFLRATDTAAQTELLRALEWVTTMRDRYAPCVGEGAVTRAVALGQDDTGLAYVCWVMLQDGKLLVTFDDTDRLDRQLKIAGEVFGLSKSQQKLVRHIVDGRDVGAAADALGISPNTAKTHLQRIYDKTGVRSQPTLVRKLLSADRQHV